MTSMTTAIVQGGTGGIVVAMFLAVTACWRDLPSASAQTRKTVTADVMQIRRLEIVDRNGVVKGTIGTSVEDDAFLSFVDPGGDGEFAGLRRSFDVGGQLRLVHGKESLTLNAASESLYGGLQFRGESAGTNAEYTPDHVKIYKGSSGQAILGAAGLQLRLSAGARGIQMIDHPTGETRVLVSPFEPANKARPAMYHMVFFDGNGKVIFNTP